jgi:hypothetical protein
MNQLNLTRLPAAFYEETRPLSIIRQAAQASDVTPDALLGAALARVAAAIPYTIGLDYKQGSLNFYTAAVGSPGAGKSQATRAATRLLPDVGIDLDHRPCGTGEGLMQMYIRRSKDTNTDELAHHSAYLVVDEVAQLLAVKERKGDQLMPTLRSMWIGTKAGTGNADAGRVRLLKEGTYRLGAVVLFQCENAAQFVTQGAAVGDPQRFLWVDAEIDPDAPNFLPLFPTLTWRPPRSDGRQLTLPREVSDVLTIDTRAKRRGERPRDPLTAHDPYMQHKVAGILRLLHDPDAHTIDAATWNQAGQIVDVSRQNRERLTEHARQVAEMKRRENNQGRIIDADEREQHRESRAVRNLGPRIVKYLQAQNRAVSFAELQQQVAGSTTREVLPSTLAQLVDAREITARPTPNGKGTYYDLPRRK